MPAAIERNKRRALLVQSEARVSSNPSARLGPSPRTGESSTRAVMFQPSVIASRVRSTRFA